MLFHQSDAESFTIPGGTKGVLYPPHPNGEHSVAVISMDGVYPEKGYSINDVCTETMYLLEGQFEVFYQDATHTLGPGDLLMILPGNKYQVRGKGRAAVFITPSWDSKQNHIIP